MINIFAMGFVWEKIIRPAAFRLEPERAHEIGINLLAKAGRFGETLAERFFDPGEWPPIERFGLTFSNPIGLAAGFDKNAIAVSQLASLGFGFIEVGTVTLNPQPGNPKPRLFRLESDLALVNRLGFNNDGAEIIAKRLQKVIRKCPVGINIGRNKDVPNAKATENYTRAFELLAPHADYVAINVSSPNTPGLRGLQGAENLDHLLAAIAAANQALERQKPILVKISPDLSTAEVTEIAEVCLRRGVSGVIATNTTVSREGLKAPAEKVPTDGGMSGKPLQKHSNRVISTLYRYAGGRLPIVGVGGIMTAEDAFEKIAAGASLLQVYTGFIYGGPGFPAALSRRLLEIMRSRGFASLDEVVGAAA